MPCAYSIQNTTARRPQGLLPAGCGGVYFSGPFEAGEVYAATARRSHNLWSSSCGVVLADAWWSDCLFRAPVLGGNLALEVLPASRS